MKSQIFVAIGVAIVASVLVSGLASTIYAQSNMTGGNMTGGNMTGGNDCKYAGLEPQMTVEATTVMEMMETVMPMETETVMDRTMMEMEIISKHLF